MKPTCYDDYAKVFDLYSNVHLFPQNLDFIEIAAGLLAPGDRVTDVGGGTGMFTAELLERVPWVELTFVEPSPPMMEIAAARLPLGANLVHEPLDGALLAGLPAQKLFLFQRSLYSLHGELEPYRELARQIAERTLAGGHVAIYEMPGPYDMEVAWMDAQLGRILTGCGLRASSTTPSSSSRPTTDKGSQADRSSTAGADTGSSICGPFTSRS